MASFSTITMLVEDLSLLVTKAGSFRSFLTFFSDRVSFPFLKGVSTTGAALRDLKLRDGIEISYRRNRGDIWTIREVLLEGCYTLPFEQEVNTYVDLGTNIGLTTLWMNKRYSPSRIIAVEPDEENHAIAKRNFERNGLELSFKKVAIGAEDGEAFFSKHSEANMGRVSEEGTYKVQVLGMKSLLAELPPDEEIDLLKVDIEGGEDDLFSGDLSWLQRVRTIIAEFHPHLVDCEAIRDRIIEHGFRHHKAGEFSPGSMECFVRS